MYAWTNRVLGKYKINYFFFLICYVFKRWNSRFHLILMIDIGSNFNFFNDMNWIFNSNVTVMQIRCLYKRYVSITLDKFMPVTRTIYFWFRYLDRYLDFPLYVLIHVYIFIFKKFINPFYTDPLNVTQRLRSMVNKSCHEWNKPVEREQSMAFLFFYRSFYRAAGRGEKTGKTFGLDSFILA